MAKFTIDRLNYMTAGRNRMFLNIDRSPSDIPRRETILAALEDGRTVAGLEGLSTMLKLDHVKDTDVYERWISAYVQGQTTRGMTFDMEVDQVGQDVNDMRSFNPMYDMADVHVKSALPNRKDTFEKFDDSANQSEDVYNPDIGAKPVQFCKSGSYTYMMTEPTSCESHLIDVDVQGAGDTDGYYVPSLRESPHRTVFMPALSSLSLPDGSRPASLDEYFSEGVSAQSDIQSRMDGYFGSTRSVGGVRYNHVLALAHGNAQRWSNAENMTEYRNGNVYADIYPLKNAYDSRYSMDMDQSSQMSSCREYVGMGETRGRIWLKYQDDVQYSADGGGDMQMRIPAERTWQKVETMMPAQVGSQAMHKSTFFSIRLDGTGLAGDDPALEPLRRDVENSIRDIAKRFAPANTQLFEVQVRD